ncbi:NAD(P)-dependent oxidoreductase [Rhodococcus sp. D2-41]|uniref:NAD(P)-dependent oxidoreductase n=1 Tax=Speluncibacter jeojiensis TaxID=2710754 RepID=A0A9X4RH00_9ACTN|nr:NAD(P)-dependent oxidoreductase [Rhodococcus sp. D2-41]MDG3009805.1 NAD(P)-dependent oxidoreductase [Rhodococcus sp. D2-41]MDG3014556.1 NAD(P)-dependent oxidoreductase [Corynebacteriales bacterium D3-21]
MADDGPASAAGRVVLLGAAGVTGRATLPRLLDAGYRVTAHSRRPQRSADPRVTWHDGDIAADETLLRAIVDGADAVIDLRVALPTSLRTLGALAQYRKVRDTAMGQVVDACLECAVPRIVRDTVTMVYRDGGDRLLDEDSAVAAPGPMRANLAAEEHARRFTRSGGVGVALRFGMIHGDDPLTAMIESVARRGWFAIPGRADAYVAPLALADVGTAVVAALRAPAGLYNVADEPLTRAQWAADYARRVGRDRLRLIPGWLGGPMGRSQRVSSARFTEATGWRPSRRA